MPQLTDRYVRMCCDDNIQKFRFQKGTRSKKLRAGDSYTFKTRESSEEYDIRISVNNQCFAHTSLCVWIPTKHQLEMILLSKKFADDFEIFEEKLFLFLQKNARKFKSMFELFMGFFMYEMYKLKWDNENGHWLPEISDLIDS